jgi:hypothetical protein
LSGSLGSHQCRPLIPKSSFFATIGTAESHSTHSDPSAAQSEVTPERLPCALLFAALPPARPANYSRPTPPNRRHSRAPGSSPDTATWTTDRVGCCGCDEGRPPRKFARIAPHGAAELQRVAAISRRGDGDGDGGFGQLHRGGGIQTLNVKGGADGDRRANAE